MLSIEIFSICIYICVVRTSYRIHYILILRIQQKLRSASGHVGVIQSTSIAIDGRLTPAEGLGTKKKKDCQSKVIFNVGEIEHTYQVRLQRKCSY